MTQLRAIIIDDEPLAHKVILQYAQDVPFLDIIGQCYKATEAYAILEKETIDLIFLDINMPRLKGLDFLRTLEHPPAVVITSAYEEYALEGYELRVADYLLKPFSFERFLRAVNTIRKQHSFDLQKPSGTDTGEATAYPEQLFIKVDKRQLQLNFSDIHYLESFGNYVKVWTGTTYHLTARTLTSFLDLLPPDFARIHKSFIVRKQSIEYIEGATVLMKSQRVLPVGKNFRAVVREWF
jgi:DNA-binding LytR/AlgR family response regulator